MVQAVPLQAIRFRDPDPDFPSNPLNYWTIGGFWLFNN